MHIKIENDQNETEAVLCIERGHDYARILYCKPEHIRTLTNIAQSLGATTMLIEVELTLEEVQKFESMGFVPANELVPMIKRLNNETKSKRG